MKNIPDFKKHVLILVAFLLICTILITSCGGGQANGNPTVTPTVSTDIPTTAPTDIPTTAPTDIPTTAPTDIPTTAPTTDPTPAYSSTPCITVSKNSFAFYSGSSGVYKQDTLVLSNCGPTGSWGSVIGTNGLDSRIHFDMNPKNQPEDGSFPSGAQVTLTVFVTADPTLPAGHYTGDIDFNVYGNGITRNNLAIVNLTFDQG